MLLVMSRHGKSNADFGRKLDADEDYGNSECAPHSRDTLTRGTRKAESEGRDVSPAADDTESQFSIFKFLIKKS